ncbi:MAG: tetratricopeptide repeat protein [Candidatus Sulfomarinibacteraceae bacterium]
MILSDSDLGAIVQNSEGSLEEVPFAVLLLALARAERSVTLSITRRPKVKEITIERGVPVHCRSNLAHETLSRFMQSIGSLDQTTANECFSEACSRGVRFGDVLLDRGLITAEGLRKLLQKNLARKLLDGFSWLKGEYRLSDFPSEVDSALAVNVPQLIILGVTRFATQAQVDAAIGPLIGKPLGLHPDPIFKPSDMRLSLLQTTIIEALDGAPLRIDELGSAIDVDDDDLARTLFALALIGVVVPAAVPTGGFRRNRPVPPPRPATTPAPSSRPPSPEPKPIVHDTRRTTLMEMVLNYRRKDAFELLGVDPYGFGRDVKERFLEFAEAFAPWTYPDEVADDARRVFLAGAQAFGELSDPDRRQALANRREGRAARRGSVDTFRIETDLLDPDVQFRKGRALMAEGNYRDAIEQLSYASDLDPQNGQYRAELAHCRYRFNPQAGGPVAIAELKKALRIDPGAGLAHFYQGEILAEMGMVDEAREALRRAIKPMAPDRRPIEALKRLQRSS